MIYKAPKSRKESGHIERIRAQLFVALCLINVVALRQGRCSGKFVAPENYSHTQQYGLGLKLRIGLN